MIYELVYSCLMEHQIHKLSTEEMGTIRWVFCAMKRNKIIEEDHEDCC